MSFPNDKLAGGTPSKNNYASIGPFRKINSNRSRSKKTSTDRRPYNRGSPPTGPRSKIGNAPPGGSNRPTNYRSPAGPNIQKQNNSQSGPQRHQTNAAPLAGRRHQNSSTPLAGPGPQDGSVPSLGLHDQYHNSPSDGSHHPDQGGSQHQIHNDAPINPFASPPSSPFRAISTTSSFRPLTIAFYGPGISASPSAPPSPCNDRNHQNHNNNTNPGSSSTSSSSGRQSNSSPGLHNDAGPGPLNNIGTGPQTNNSSLTEPPPPQTHNITPASLHAQSQDVIFASPASQHHDNRNTVGTPSGQFHNASLQLNDNAQSDNSSKRQPKDHDVSAPFFPDVSTFATTDWTPPGQLLCPSPHPSSFHFQTHDPTNLLALTGMNECAFDAQSKDYDLVEATSAAKTYRDAVNTMNRAYIDYYDGPESSVEAQQRSNEHLDHVEAARNNAEATLRAATNAWFRGLTSDPEVRHTTREAREALWEAQRINAMVRGEVEYKATRARRAADAAYHNLVMSDRNAHVDPGLLAVVARQPGVVVRDGLVARLTPIYEVDSRSATMSMSSGQTPSR